MKMSNEIQHFSGTVAIVTGGASGIGRSLSLELVKRGATVVVADLQKELAIDLVNTLTLTGGNALARTIDVTDYHAFETLVTEVIEQYGRLDFLFNNAGIMFMGDAEKYSIDDWNLAVDVNLRGVINGVQACYNRMRLQGFGHIINTASMAGLIPTAGSIGYTTTKHAVVGLSKGLLAEAAVHNVRVSTFCPGIIRTPLMTSSTCDGKIEQLDERQQKNFLGALEKMKPMDPNLFATRALDAVARNQFLIILPRWNRLFWLLNRVSSRLGLTFSKLAYKNLKKSMA